jgi:hypothetical protein
LKQAGGDKNMEDSRSQGIEGQVKPKKIQQNMNIGEFHPLVESWDI